MLTAIVVYDGVLDDECEAFACVLGTLRGGRIELVATRPGRCAGTGGGQIATVGFDALDHADIVVVPGGLGCERLADDTATRGFLVRMARSARYVAASSTGSVVLAAAGLLHGRPAATHWLAGELLRRYGSDADERHLVVSGNVITCEGRLTAVDAAFSLVERLAGPAEVERIRAELLRRGEPLLRTARWWDRLGDAARERVTGHRSRRSASAPAAGPGTVTPLSVMIELVDDPELVRRMRQRAGRRNGPR